MNNKLLIPVITMLLASCTPTIPVGDISNHIGNSDSSTDENSDSEDKYVVTKEIYDRELNRDTVLFRSNYIVQMTSSNSSSPLVTQFDYGKAIVNDSQYYDFTELEDDFIKMFSCSLEGDYSYEQTIPKASLYSYWFMSYDFLFDIPFEVLTYDTSLHAYVGINFNVQEIHINRAVIISYNNKPQSMVFDIEGVGTCSAIFSCHGEISLSRPDVNTNPNGGSVVLSEASSDAGGGGGQAYGENDGEC